MSLDLKSDFQKFQKESYETLRVESQRGWFKTSLTYGLASLADNGATAQEINGANRLVEILNNLAADKVEIKRLPVKELTFLDARTEAKPSKEKEENK